MDGEQMRRYIRCRTAQTLRGTHLNVTVLHQNSLLVGMGLDMESGLDLARFPPELYLTRQLQRMP